MATEMSFGLWRCDACLASSYVLPSDWEQHESGLIYCEECSKPFIPTFYVEVEYG